MELIQMGG